MSGKKNTLAKKIMSLIQEGKIAIDKLEIKSKAVLFVGMTGAGKSTLINYLNDVPLEAVSYDGNVKLQAKDSSQELTGIKIGHSNAVSCTRHPSVFSPQDEAFSYVDTPGFGDTGSAQDVSIGSNTDAKEIKTSKVAQDIANAYFRRDIVEKADELKIVLVVTHNDLKSRSGVLLKTLRDLSYFLQGLNEGEAKKIQDAISIVVTKVDKGAEQSVETHLKSFIQASPELLAMKSMREVLIHIVNKKHYACFTTPTSSGDKTPDETLVIRDLIENQTAFVSKEDAKLAIKVSDENASEVIHALNDLDIVGKKLAESIDKDISEKLKTAFVKGMSFVEKLKTKCEKVKKYTTVRTLKAFLEDVRAEFDFSAGTKKTGDEFEELLTFLIDLLPEEDRGKYTNEKNWLKELGLDAILTSHITTAAEMLSAPTVSFNDGKLIVSGYHIKTSQVDEEIQKYTGITSIEIRALHTITIDNDLADTNEKCKGKLHGVNLSMFSPNIEVVGDKKIDLSGKDGEASKVIKASSGKQGVDGAIAAPANPGSNGTGGEKGTDGLPGESGGSAGNLFIVSDVFPDREKLSVVLKGGAGAKGQNGGDGGIGGNGSSACWEEEGLWGEKVEKFPLPIARFVTTTGWINVGGEWKEGEKKYQEKRLNGGKGGDGGAGGKGGKGGDGGKKGQCLFIMGNKAVDIKKLDVSDGKAGNSGDAGKPGEGGTAGKYARGVWSIKENRWSKSNGKRPEYFDCEVGSRGTKPTDLNEVGWVETTKIASPNLLCVLLSYKLFLKQQIVKYPKVVDEYLDAFKQHCDEIEVADLKAITSELLEEANALEDYAAQYSSTINFLPFYYSLLSRVKTFALETTRTPEEINALEYLYVAALGSITRINAAADNLLIMDIYGYVKNLVGGDFATLQKFQAKELQEYYRKQYQENVESKIDEAQSFLEILKQDINSRQAEIAPKIESLIEEVNQLMQEATKQWDKLNAKKRELEEALHKKMVFGVIGIAVQGIGMMFPPTGPIVAGVINAGLSMASDPSLATVTNFATKVVEMKSKLGDLPKGEEIKKHEVDLFEKVQEMAKTVAPLIKDAKALLGQKGEGDAKLKQIDDQIASVSAYIQELEVYLKTVPNALENYLEGMVHEVQTFQTALQDKSLVALDFSKLEIKRFFADMVHNIKAVVGKFASAEEFSNIAAKMEEAIEVSVNICSRVQDYRDHIAFANYIAHLQTAVIQGIKVGDQYQSSFDKLELRLKQNIVQEAYNRVIAAIQQWAFPFTKKFLSAIENLETTKPEIMAKNLQAILDRIEEYKNSVVEIDQAITSGEFNTTFPNMPFATWAYDNAPQKIEALLKGEKVIFYADVCQQNLDAVKFRQVGIELICALGGDKQAELNTLLQKGYKVTLTHSGISNYRFGDVFWQVTSDKLLEISCSFGMKSDGTPQHYTAAWEKMYKGDVLLSPYTTWIVQIEPMPNSTMTMEYLFNNFRTVMPHIKMHLTGSGSYVDATKVKSDLHLNDYYHQVESEMLVERSQVATELQSVSCVSQKANAEVSEVSVEEILKPKNQSSYCMQYTTIGGLLALGGFFALAATRGDICSSVAEGLCETIKNNLF